MLSIIKQSTQSYSTWYHFVGFNVAISLSLNYYVLVYQLPIVDKQLIFIPMYSTGVRTRLSAININTIT